jgi:hypothetical protein
LLLAVSGFALGQAKPAASRSGDLQVGAGFTTASPDYGTDRIRGFAFYGDFDFRPHIGLEVDFHQLNSPKTDIYERSYEVGGRYFRRYGRSGAFKPYGKVLYGRGVFNFPLNEANLAYNMLAFGGGLDYELTNRINLRGEFEYQHWFSGLQLPDGLTPTLVTFGAAYHFPAGSPRGTR